jgi:hypothetical protein
MLAYISANCLRIEA